MSYYITGIAGMRYRPLAGPYKTQADAMADVDRAAQASWSYHNGAFDDLTVEWLDGFSQPAALNTRGFVMANNPTPQQVREARSGARLTAQKAAALIYRTQRNWFQWERGERKMCPALFELFCIKVKNNE